MHNSSLLTEQPAPLTTLSQSVLPSSNTLCNPPNNYLTNFIPIVNNHSQNSYYGFNQNTENSNLVNNNNKNNSAALSVTTTSTKRSRISDEFEQADEQSSEKEQATTLTVANKSETANVEVPNKVVTTASTTYPESDEMTSCTSSGTSCSGTTSDSDSECSDTCEAENTLKSKMEAIENNNNNTNSNNANSINLPQNPFNLSSNYTTVNTPQQNPILISQQHPSHCNVSFMSNPDLSRTQHFHSAQHNSDIMHMMLKMKQQSNGTESPMSECQTFLAQFQQHQHQQPMHGSDITDDQSCSPLTRTCSNASSTSTASGSTNLSSKDSDSSYNMSNESMLSSSSGSGSMSSLMNENHLKALIMSAAAAAISSKGSNSHQTNSQANSSMTQPVTMPVPTATAPGETNNESMAVAVAAAFADQFAYMVRSRSSSLSESSSSSMSTSSSATLPLVEFTSKTSEHTEFFNALMANQSNLSSHVMKQMLSTYQNALSSSAGGNGGIKLGEGFSGQTMTVKATAAASAAINNMSQCNNLSKVINDTKDSNSGFLQQNTGPVEVDSMNGTARKLSFSSAVHMTSTSATNVSESANTIHVNYKLDAQQQNKHLNNSSHMLSTSEEIKTKINETTIQHKSMGSSLLPNNNNTNNGMSPTATPCKVCGDEASGFHYGVDSCEGCKGFFRRCITQGMNHQCTNNQQCDMTPFSRNSCQFCRLKKCFAVGMSREASRLGRRPKRAKDDKESTFSISDSGCGGGGTTSPGSTPGTTPLKESSSGLSKPPPFKPDFASVEQLASNSSELKKTPTNASRDSLLKVAPSPQHAITTDETIYDLSNQNRAFKSKKEKIQLYQQQQQQLQQQQQNQLLHAPPSAPFRLEMPAEKTLNDDHQTKMSSQIQNKTTEDSKFINSQIETFLKAKPMMSHHQNANETITGSNNNITTSANSNNSFRSVAQLQKETAQQQMHQIEMLTKLISVSDKHTSIERSNELEHIRAAVIEAHAQIWPTTFEKIRRRYIERPPTRCTGQNELVVNCFIEALVPMIMDVVKFCKCIPGFNHIVQHDQVQLLKQGSFEVICVNSFMLVDAQNRLMLTPHMDYLIDSNTIKSIPLGFFMSEVFDLALQMAQLKLSDAENSLFNALLIMNPDRGDLQDKDHIEELQAMLLHVLFKHLKYFRPDGIDVFFKLLKLVPLVQEINRKHSEALNTMRQPVSSSSCSNQQVSNNNMIGSSNANTKQQL